MPLSATRSALLQVHLDEFLALVARVRTNSFKLKRVFGEHYIMGSNDKDHNSLMLMRRSDTLMRRYALVK